MIVVLTKEAAAAYATARRGGPKFKSPRVYEQLHALEVGEAVIITRKEWRAKMRPSMSIHRIMRKHKPGALFKVRPSIDGTGWIITRTK